MIQFPETAQREWEIAETKATAGVRFREAISREVEVANAVERLRINHEAREQFQRELEAAHTPPLEMMTLADFKANPALAPADVIDGVMKEEGLCAVLGPSGSGKSSIALQMIHSILTGDDFLGQAVKKSDGAAGIMSYDMDASMIFDWLSGAPGLDPNRVIAVNAHRRGNPMAVPAQRAAIAAAWRDAKVDVVLIDSFSASFFGTSQNDATETVAHYRDCLRFALTECGAKALIMVVHSTTASPDKARGSTANQDVADTIVRMTTGDGGVRRLDMLKYREAHGQTMMPPVLLTAPDSVTHLTSVDVGQMQLAGMDIPNRIAFTATPEPYEEPDIGTDDDSEKEEDQ